MRTRLITVVSGVFHTDAFVMFIALVPTLRYALANKALPTISGIRLLSGAFESLGIEVMIVAGILFVFVSAMKVLAANWLWKAKVDGAVLGLILVGLIAIFWYGFELPVGWLFGIVEVVLLLLAWRRLGERKLAQVQAA